MAEPEKKRPGLAALVIGMGKPPKSKAGEDGDDTTEDGSEEADEDYSATVDELFDALKNDDRAGFSQAFKAAVMSCK
jgi:hypothetical protein